jgi:hypothetical protein
MASQAQILANRKNAQASTGPRTPQGKSISSGNAIKHGLSAAFRVLPDENQQDFDELVAEYNRTFAPATTHERFLVEEMVQSRWRLARVRRLETAVIEQMIGPGDPADADFQLANAFINNTAGPLIVLQRYAAAAERTGYRALQQLLALRRLEAHAARDATRQNEANSRVSPRREASLAASNPLDPFNLFNPLNPSIHQTNPIQATQEAALT